jgi:acyl-CoA dehydrogenase
MSIDDTHDLRSLIEDQANRIFADLCTKDAVDAAERGEWPERLWRTLEENGLTQAAVPEALGGGGGAIGDGFALLRLAGRYAAPVPLAETFLAGVLLAAAGRTVPAGPLTVALPRPGIALDLGKIASGWALAGTAPRVAWGRQAKCVLVVAESGGRMCGALVKPGTGTITQSTNLAGEPRDDIHFDANPVPADQVFALNGFDRAALYRLGALSRAVMMAGALESILDMAIRYANERKQFGRPIGNFQAIQQSLAVVAGQTAASGSAADAAIRAVERGGGAVEVAVAKARVGEAAGLAAGIVHQVHAAMGFTHEHPLHQRTRRLWSWRDEYGAEPYWQAELGRRIAKAGADDLWSFVTSV